MEKQKTYQSVGRIRDMQRITRLKQLETKQGKPAATAIFNPTNIIYFTSFSGATALYIPEDGNATLLVSDVNYEQAKAELKNIQIELLKPGENLMQKIAQQNPNQLSVDTLSIENWRSLTKAMGGENKLELVGDLVRKLRSVKEPEEIKFIREACRIATIGMTAAKQTIGVGVKEKDVAAQVEYEMRRAGSEGVAFDTIIASGPTSAYPHGGKLERIIEDFDFVTVDIGATCNFYCSDITRTFIASKATDKHAKIYDTVKLAHERGVEAIENGTAAKDVDAAARAVIAGTGLGEYFCHNLGHGIGLQIHEAPILSKVSKDILEAGNVVTIEPGIYLPGFGGVRIEDSVLVTEKGAEILTVGPCMP
jgi:Xaa-Pro dipeptidase